MSKSEFYHREINFNQNTGKLMSTDSHNITYKCNLYGDRYPAYLPNVTGIANSKARKKITNDFNLKSNYEDEINHRLNTLPTEPNIPSMTSI